MFKTRKKWKKKLEVFDRNLEFFDGKNKCGIGIWNFLMGKINVESEFGIF